MMLCGAISQNAHTDCVHPYLNSLTCIRENTFSTNVVNRTTKHIITRIMMGYKNNVSCRNLFRRLEILPFVSQYIHLLTLFVGNNKILFTLNSENHTRGTRQSNNFYQPITNLTVYQKGVHYMGIKIFNNLPPYIKDLSNNVTKFEIYLN